MKAITPRELSPDTTYSVSGKTVKILPQARPYSTPEVEVNGVRFETLKSKKIQRGRGSVQYYRLQTAGSLTKAAVREDGLFLEEAYDGRSAWDSIKFRVVTDAEMDNLSR